MPITLSSLRGHRGTIGLLFELHTHPWMPPCVTCAGWPRWSLPLDSGHSARTEWVNMFTHRSLLKWTKIGIFEVAPWSTNTSFHMVYKHSPSLVFTYFTYVVLPAEEVLAVCFSLICYMHLHMLLRSQLKIKHFWINYCWLWSLMLSIKLQVMQAGVQVKWTEPQQNLTYQYFTWILYVHHKEIVAVISLCWRRDATQVCEFMWKKYEHGQSLDFQFKCCGATWNSMLMLKTHQCS